MAVSVEEILRGAATAGELAAPISSGRRRPSDQVDAAQDEGARDALAELGLGDQQRAEPSGGIEQHLDLALGVAVDQRRLARQRVRLGEELPGPLLDHGAT